MCLEYTSPEFSSRYSVKQIHKKMVRPCKCKVEETALVQFGHWYFSSIAKLPESCERVLETEPATSEAWRRKMVARAVI